MTTPTPQRPSLTTLLVLLTAMAGLLTGPLAASATEAQLWQNRRQSQTDEAGISRAQAAAIAQQRHGGRVLSVKRSRDGRVWQVKLLLDQERVRNINVDAQSGQLR